MIAPSIAQPDITLQLDPEGIIWEATVSEHLLEDLQAWIGRRWADTVADVGGEKVQRLVADARERNVSGFRQINQRFPSGREVLIEYTAVRLRDPGGFIAIGRSVQAVTEMQTRLIAAQHEMEREYWKLRELETRYRLLFDTSNEAVLLVRAANLRIVEANPAALRALGLAPYPPGVVGGQEFLPALPESDRTALQAMLDRVRVHKRAPGILVRLGRERTPWLVRASLTQADTGILFLLQFTPAATLQPGFDRGPLSAETLIELLPDAFVVCDGAGVIAHGNQAFATLTGAEAAAAMAGEPLARRLGWGQADVLDFIDEVSALGVLRNRYTTIRDAAGAPVGVEIAAVAGTQGELRHVGMLLHATTDARSPDRDTAAATDLP